MTKYQKIKRYINKHKIGRIVRRQDLLRINKEIKKKDMSTTDNYRAMLMKVGILERTSRPGEYLIKEHIKDSLTLHKLRKLSGTEEQMLIRNVQWLGDVFTQQ